MKAPSHRLHPLTIVGVVIVLAVPAFFLTAARKTVLLRLDGQERSITTYAFTVGQFMGQSGIAISPQDIISPPVETWIKNGSLIQIDRAVPVQVAADGKEQSLFTAERQTGRLLEMASASLYPGDMILADGRTVSPEFQLGYAPSHSLWLRRAISIQLKDGGEEKDILSASSTLGQALWEAGIRLATGDQLYPQIQSYVSNGEVHAQLMRARPVTVHVDGKELRASSAASKVGEVLAVLGVPLQGLDYSHPAEDEVVPEDGNIEVVRVSEKVILEQAPIPFENQQQALPDVELDSQQLVQPGEYGLSARRVRVRLENGQEVSRQIEDEWVARQPKPRITGYGTKIVMHTLETPDGVIQYWRALRVYLTSYHPSETGSDITASGQRLRKGIVAVNRGYIPFGTQMYIPGYGFAEAADTGRLSPRMVDLAYPDDQYVGWHQWEIVYFLWPPPANIVYVFPP